MNFYEYILLLNLTRKIKGEGNMKKLFLVVLLISGLFFTNGYSTIYRVEVGPGLSRTFVPGTITTANVGDTIRWVWISGVHTTTSALIPAGAAAWNSPIDAADTAFNYVITLPGTYNYTCVFHSILGMTGSFIAAAVGIQPNGEIVNSYSLSQNLPNPFNPSTVIKFSIPKSSFVTLKVYDVSGKEVKNLVNSQLSQGGYNYTMNGSDLSSGVYYYKITAGEFTEVKRMVLIK